MPRVSGVDIPPNKRVDVALTYVYGIGPYLARQILAESVLLAAAGCLLGLFVAWAGVRFVHTLPAGSLHPSEFSRCLTLTSRLPR